MHRIVVTAFKAVAYAMIFVIIWSVVFYLFRVFALNSKLETIMVSMRQDVSQNNYLTEDRYEMYKTMLLDVANEMNNGDTFVVGYNLNYAKGDKSNACVSDDTPSNMGLHYTSDGYKMNGATNSPTYSLNLAKPAACGDVAVIELQVGFNAISWRYDTAEQAAADELKLTDDIVNTITYTYQVPCLKYVNVVDTK